MKATFLDKFGSKITVEPMLASSKQDVQDWNLHYPNRLMRNTHSEELLEKKALQIMSKRKIESELKIE